MVGVCASMGLVKLITRDPLETQQNCNENTYTHTNNMAAALQVEQQHVDIPPSVAEALHGLDVQRQLQGTQCLPLLRDPHSYRASTFDWLDKSCVRWFSSSLHPLRQQPPQRRCSTRPLGDRLCAQHPHICTARGRMRHRPHSGHRICATLRAVLPGCAGAPAALGSVRQHEHRPGRTTTTVCTQACATRAVLHPQPMI